MTRKNLMRIGKVMNLQISYMRATEAICYCRGPELDNSPEYDHDKFFKWLMENIKMIRPYKKEEILPLETDYLPTTIKNKPNLNPR